MALGLGVGETAVAAAAVVLVIGIAYRHATRGGDVSASASTAAGSVEFDASSDGDEEPAAEGTVSGDGEADLTVTSHSGGTSLREISGVGAVTANNLTDAGFHYAEDVAEASTEELTDVTGIGGARAEQFQSSAEEATSGNGDGE